MGKELWILNSLGLIAHETGNYEAAAHWFEQTIAVQKEKDNNVLLAINWMNYGRTLSQLQHFDQAVDAYDKSLYLLDGTDAKLDRCHIQISHGDTLAQMGRYNQAENLFRAIDLNDLNYLRQADHRRLQMLVTHNLASVLLSQRNYQQASLYFDEAYKVGEANNYTVLMGTVLKMKGEIAYHDGDMIQASQYFERAREIFIIVDTSWTSSKLVEVVEWLDKIKSMGSSHG